MKIAVCLSGQLRNWEIAKFNQKWFWETSSADQIDYFIHTWNYSGDRRGVSQPYEWRKVNKHEFNKNLALSLSCLNIFNDMHREMIGGAKMGRQIILRFTSTF